MKHNKRQDAWMVLNNKVYDVTNYIPFHPGGAKILAGVGRDATELYSKTFILNDSLNFENR